uniref:Uncharacterized protein n=1 Tax=Arundo donax TaxID=35708 RepID=A0A0A9BE86_ARUDO
MHLIYAYGKGKGLLYYL